MSSVNVHRVYETCVEVPITPEEEAVLLAGPEHPGFEHVHDWCVIESGTQEPPVEFGWACSILVDDKEVETELRDW